MDGQRAQSQGADRAWHAGLLARRRADAQQPEQHDAGDRPVPRGPRRARERLAVTNGGVRVAGQPARADHRRLREVGQEPAAHAGRQRLQGGARRGRAQRIRRRAAAFRGRRRRRAPHHRRHQVRYRDDRQDDRDPAAGQRARLPVEHRERLQVHGASRRRRDAAPLHAARRRRLRAQRQPGARIHVRVGLHRARWRPGGRTGHRRRGGGRDHRGL